MTPSPIIPHHPYHESHCPYCLSVQTEYHPNERWGKCHAAGCGKSWRFLPYRLRVDPVPGIDAPAITRYPHEGRTER